MPYYISCTICREPITSNAEDHCLLQCGHLFHQKCITLWESMSPSPKCPVCRQSSSHSNIKIFLCWESCNDSNSDKLKEITTNHENTKKELDTIKATLQLAQQKIAVLTNELQEMTKRRQSAEEESAKQHSNCDTLKSLLIKFRRRASIQNVRMKELESYFKVLMGVTENIDLPVDINFLENKDALATCLKSFLLTAKQKESEIERLVSEIHTLKKNWDQAESELAECKAREERAQTIIESLKETIHKMSLERSFPDPEAQKEISPTPTPIPRRSPRKKRESQESMGDTAQMNKTKRPLSPNQSGTSQMKMKNKALYPGPTSTAGVGSAGLRPCKVFVKKFKHA